MAIPSGSGTEVLKRATLHAINNTGATLLTGVANHIYTILTISFNNQTGTAGDIEITVHDGTNDIRLLRTFNVGGSASFVYSDKFVMEGDDVLKINNVVTSGDWYCSYIDQDWT